MKQNNIDKIEEHFREIKTESIFSALKENKYKGVKRNEIGHLLKSYNINQVYSYLKTRYKKHNYLITYLISLVCLLTILSGVILFSYISAGELIFLEYLDINYYSELQLRDYGILLLFSLTMLAIILCMYEFILRLKNFK
jgi:hypothetical protein